MAGNDNVSSLSPSPHRNIDVTLRSAQGDTAEELSWRCGSSGYLFEMVEDSVDYRYLYR